jgi:hypothetical protein
METIEDRSIGFDAHEELDVCNLFAHCVWPKTIAVTKYYGC